MLPTYRTHARHSGRRSRPWWGILPAAFGALAASGCGGDGGVELALELPERAELSPIESEIGEISLVTYIPEQTPRTETRELDDPSSSLSMGRLEVGAGISLAVELRTPSGRLVGYGRSQSSIEVEPDRVVTVPIKVRRPFIYVTGGNSLATFDSTQDATSSANYRSSIALSRAPVVAVSTSDGADIAVIGANGNSSELTLVSSSDHLPSSAPPVTLVAPAVDVAASPDNRWIVVGHGGDNGGISIIDLEAARAGSAEPQFVALGNVGAVGFGARANRPLVVALLNRGEGSSCPTTPPSTVVAVDLDDPTGAPVMIPHNVPLHDIAVSDDGNQVVAADLCSNRIQLFSLIDDVQPSELTVVQDPTAVAVLDDRAWAVGTLPPMNAQPRRLILVSVDLDGGGETRVELPPTRERARSVDFSGDGQQAEQRMDADDLIAYDLAVAPGSDHVALLSWAYFHADEDGDFLGAPIIPEMTVETNEYILVNASTTAVVQRVRTRCDLDWVSDPFNPPVLDRWECTRDDNQDESDQPYLPRHLSILYGGR